MKIGIDAHFLSKISQGTGTYTYNLIDKLNKIVTDEIYLLNKKNIVHLWENSEKLQSARLFSNFSPFNVLLGYYSTSIKYHLDIIHTNYFCPLFLKNTKSVVTVHDIMYKTHPLCFPNLLRVGTGLLHSLCLKKADRIITVSNYTKQQLLSFFPYTKDKVDVVYEAASPDFHVVDRSNQSFRQYLFQLGIQKPYILFVGRLARIKNIERLIDVYLASGLNIKYNLVIVGKFDKSFPNKCLEEKIRGDKNIIHLCNVPNSELNVLYNYAKCLYFVSYGEGFGLPILEAMSSGCPVLTSNTTSCDEIAGDAALKVNPYSNEEIKKGLHELLENENKRNYLIEKGMERSKIFSWEKCAKQTLEVYKRVLRN